MRIPVLRHLEQNLVIPQPLRLRAANSHFAVTHTRAGPALAAKFVGHMSITTYFHGIQCLLKVGILSSFCLLDSSSGIFQLEGTFPGFKAGRPQNLPLSTPHPQMVAFTKGLDPNFWPMVLIDFGK